MVLAAASGLTVFIGLLVARVRIACLTVGFLTGFAAESDTTSKAGGLVNVTTSKVVELSYLDL